MPRLWLSRLACRSAPDSFLLAYRIKGTPVLLSPTGVPSPPFFELIVKVLICVNYEGAWFLMIGYRGTEELCCFGLELFMISDRLGFASIMRSGCTSLKIDGNFIFSLSVESKRVDLACLGSTCLDFRTWVCGTPVLFVAAPLGRGAFMFKVLTVRLPWRGCCWPGKEPDLAKFCYDCLS